MKIKSYFLSSYQRWQVITNLKDAVRLWCESLAIDEKAYSHTVIFLTKKRTIKTS